MIRKEYKMGILILLIMLLTACSDTNEQTVSRSVRSSDIVVSSENSNKPDPSSESDIGSEESRLPDETFEFDANISFSDSFLVVNYGKSTVNVYQANYDQPSGSWGDEWLDPGMFYVKDWAMGHVSGLYLEKGDSVLYFCQERDVSIKNLQNVRVATLNEIDDFEEIQQRLGIGPESRFLCWTLEVRDFPIDLFGRLDPSIAEMDVSKITTIQFANVGAQYIDGLPVTGCDRDTRRCITYDWPGVIKPSRLAYFRGSGEAWKANPSRTAVIEIDKARYNISKTVSSDLSLVDPDSCLEEIKRALAYRPETNGRISTDPGKPNLLDIWGKDIEIYCAELVYLPLDAQPYKMDESEDSLFQHEISLVPVWEIYYTITNTENETTVEYGSLPINAVTGKSMYSEEYGADENKGLFPEKLSGKG